MKTLFSSLLWLVSVTASAQFIQGQTLTAAQLNAALAAPTITGGSITGVPVSATTLKVTNPLSTSSNIGLYSYGTLSFLDSNVVSSYQANVNGYFQQVIQNTSSGAQASSDYVVNNNLGTAVAYYVDLGMNSSGFTGVGSMNLPNAGYLYVVGGDLTLGTQSLNAIHLCINTCATDNATVFTTGNVGINNPTDDGVNVLQVAGSVRVTGTINHAAPDNLGSAVPTIVSASTIAPTTTVAFVSGTTAIVNITPPTGCTNSCTIYLIPTGLFTTTAAGNIAIASTAVVNKQLILTYESVSAKWYPSY